MQPILIPVAAEECWRPQVIMWLCAWSTSRPWDVKQQCKFDNEQFFLLGHNTLSCQLTFRRNMQPPSSGLKSKPKKPSWSRQQAKVWRRHVSRKCLLTFNALYTYIPQKTELFITTAVRTSNPIICLVHSGLLFDPVDGSGFFYTSENFYRTAGCHSQRSENFNTVFFLLPSILTVRDEQRYIEPRLSYD
jgi:hypothetical protein